MNSKSGFTLIELLVAIAIISALAGFLLVNFIGVRQKGRDTQRKSDLKQIQSALEFYRSDTASYAPDSSFASCGSSAPLTYSSTTYMRSIPCDPLDNVKYTYTASPANCSPAGTTCSSYSIVACLENQNDPDVDKDGTGNKINCTGSTTRWRYTVQNP